MLNFRQFTRLFRIIANLSNADRKFMEFLNSSNIERAILNSNFFDRRRSDCSLNQRNVWILWSNWKRCEKIINIYIHYGTGGKNYVARHPFSYLTDNISTSIDISAQRTTWSRWNKCLFSTKLSTYCQIHDSCKDIIIF